MDELEPIKDDDMEDGGVEDEFLLPKKPKGADDDISGETPEDSLDALADEEEEILPEDRFDDTEPEDLW